MAKGPLQCRKAQEVQANSLKMSEKNPKFRFYTNFSLLHGLNASRMLRACSEELFASLEIKGAWISESLSLIMRIHSLVSFIFRLRLLRMDLALQGEVITAIS